MKQCPVCQTSYTDDSLQFCLQDGAKLLFGDADEERTISMSAKRPPLRIDFPQNAAPINAAPLTSPQVAQKKGCSPLLIAGLTVVLLIVFGGIIAAAYFFISYGNNKPADNSANASPGNSQLAKSADNTDNLNGKIANLQKQIEAQKTQKPTPKTQTSTVPTSTANLPASGTGVARVASTADGFLSLRTEPSVKTGVQIVKIPTDSVVNLSGKCQNPGRTADGKTGRWCFVTYNNQTGWVFDSYLIY